MNTSTCRHSATLDALHELTHEIRLLRHQLTAHHENPTPTPAAAPPGQPAMALQAHTDAQPVREHVNNLLGHGAGIATISTASGVAQGTIAKLVHGTPGRPATQQVRIDTAGHLMKVTVDDLPLIQSRKLIDATGTRRRCEALAACGWSQKQLADRVGLSKDRFNRWIREPALHQSLAGKVAALYEEIWDTPPPSDTPSERQTASRVRHNAQVQGWVPPMAWGGVDIDDPNAEPIPDGEDTEPDEVAVDRAVRGLTPSRDLAYVDRDEAIRQLTAQGYAPGAIAHRIGASRNTVDRVLRDEEAVA